MLNNSAAHPRAIAATHAVQTGDLMALRDLLADDPDLAVIRIGADSPHATSQTLLHVMADWPGHCPHGATTVAMLVAAGADVHARSHGPQQTPLHCAASCDDIAVVDALLDAGADIDAPGAGLTDGTPLSAAVAFAQWNAAFRLVERGATTTLITAATLGLLNRVRAYFAGPDEPTPAEINAAFGGACHGGHRLTAEFLVSRGADTNWAPSRRPTVPLDANAHNDADGSAR